MEFTARKPDIGEKANWNLTALRIHCWADLQDALVYEFEEYPGRRILANSPQDACNFVEEILGTSEDPEIIREREMSIDD